MALEALEEGLGIVVDKSGLEGAYRPHKAISAEGIMASYDPERTATLSKPLRSCSILSAETMTSVPNTVPKPTRRQHVKLLPDFTA